MGTLIIAREWLNSRLGGDVAAFFLKREDAADLFIVSYGHLVCTKCMRICESMCIACQSAEHVVSISESTPAYIVGE